MRLKFAPSVRVWSALLEGCGMEGDLDTLASQLSIMQQQGLKPTAHTWSRVLSGFGRKGHLEKMLKFHTQGLKGELGESYVCGQTFNALLTQLGGSSSLTNAVSHGVKVYADGVARGLYKTRKDFLDLRFVGPAVVPILVHHYLQTLVDKHGRGEPLNISPAGLTILVGRPAEPSNPTPDQNVNISEERAEEKTGKSDPKAIQGLPSAPKRVLDEVLCTLSPRLSAFWLTEAAPDVAMPGAQKKMRYICKVPKSKLEHWVRSLHAFECCISM
jgi:hypothetical protein